MQKLIDIVRFRVMIAPYILELLFWFGIGGTIYGSFWLLIHGNWSWSIALIFGTLATRLLFEFALLAFRSYDRIVEIRDSLARPTKHDAL